MNNVQIGVTVSEGNVLLYEAWQGGSIHHMTPSKARALSDMLISAANQAEGAMPKIESVGEPLCGICGNPSSIHTIFTISHMTDGTRVTHCEGCPEPAA